MPASQSAQHGPALCTATASGGERTGRARGCRLGLRSPELGVGILPVPARAWQFLLLAPCYHKLVMSWAWGPGIPAPACPLPALRALPHAQALPLGQPARWGGDSPGLGEGAVGLGAAGPISAAHHALVKLLLGADDAVAASVDAVPLHADRGAVGGAGRPIRHLEMGTESVRPGPVLSHHGLAPQGRVPPPTPQRSGEPSLTLGSST